RELCPASRGLGRKRPQCPALPIEQLPRRERRCCVNRYFESLRPGDRSAIDAVPDGLLLARVERAQYRWDAHKPYLAVLFSVLEPKLLLGYRLAGRLYCTRKALWKLN